MRHSGQGMILSFICTRLNFIHHQYQFWLKLAMLSDFEEDNKVKSLQTDEVRWITGAQKI